MYNYKVAGIISWIICLSINAGMGQIVINQNDLPSTGDTVRVSNGSILPGLDYTTTGPSSNWDYSNLQWVTQDVDTFVSVTSTGIVYSVVFANLPFNPNRANLAKINLLAPPVPQITIDNAVGFYYKTSSVFEQAGYGAEINGLPTAVPFDDRDRIYNLPLTYGDLDSSNSSYAIGLPGFGYYSHEQKRVNSVDGWGSITTPYGTFDAVRVKSTITGRDSIYIDATGFGFGFNTPVAREYKWLGTLKKLPILQINTTANFGNEIPSGIIYLDSLRNNTTAVEEYSIKVESQLYPIPADYTLHFTLNSPSEQQGTLTIYSTLGKRVTESLQVHLIKGTTYISLDEMIRDLPNGYYLVNLELANGNIQKRLMIAR